jgi:hypothetical protein
MFSKEACESGPLFYTTPFSRWDIFYCASIAIVPNAQAPLKNFALSFHSAVFIFPVVSNQSGGTIDTNIQIRRIPFVDSEKSTNDPGVKAATSLLKGPDHGGTRLWWDTGGSNF